MVIKHNMAAMNAQNKLKGNHNKLEGSLEKLSSGYRINRSADDASGLGISEKMRCTVAGLEQGTENTEDGIGLVRTAEGAMGEIHDILNRMKELCVQSANGTYQDAVDREAIQKEIESLVVEVDRIVEGTDFNGIPLLCRDQAAPVVIGQEWIEDWQWIVVEENGIDLGTTYSQKAIEATVNDVVSSSGTNVLSSQYYRSDSFSVPSAALSIPDDATLPYEIEMILTVYNDKTSTESQSDIKNLVVTVMMDTDGKVYGKSTQVSGDDLQDYEANMPTGATLFTDLAFASTKVSTTLFHDPSDGAGVTSTEMQMIMEKLLDNMPYETSTGGDEGTYLTSLYYADAAKWNSNGISYSSATGWKPGSTAALDYAEDNYRADELYGLSSSDNSLYGSTMFAVGNSTTQTGRVIGTQVTVTSGSNTLAETENPNNFDPLDWDSNSNLEGLTDTDILGVYRDAEPSRSEVKLDASSFVDGATLAAMTEADLENYILTLTQTTEQDINVDRNEVFDETVLAESFAVVLTPIDSKAQALLDSMGVQVVWADPDEVHKGIDELCDLIAGSSTLNFGTATRKKDHYDDVRVEDNVINCYTIELSPYSCYTNRFKDDTEEVDLGEWEDIIESSRDPIILQVADQNEDFDRVYVEIENMRPDVEELETVDASKQALASDSIKTIEEMINKVSSYRGEMGAYDNRLNHTLGKNGATTENLTEAESKIRDTDIAEEMMKYTTNNILIQSSQSMLAQANALPEGILQLLG